MDNVSVESISFKDGSTYRGQVLRKRDVPVPFGFGEMVTKEGFNMTGYFKDGKAQGRGCFKAPNGDEFFGEWNANHKRHGSGMFLRADKQRFIERYDDGKLLKRTKIGSPPAGKISWDWGFTDQIFEGSQPEARAGHTTSLLLDGAMLLVFGGEIMTEGGRMEATNDLYVLDVANRMWSCPEFSGAPPPALHGHTATVYGDELIVIGGQVGFEVSSSVYVLNVQTGVWSCPIAKGVHMVNHTASLVGDEIVCIVQGAVFILDLRKWQWVQPEVDKSALGMKRALTAVVSQTACVFGPMIVLFGGKVVGGKTEKQEKQWTRCNGEVTILHTDHLAWEVPDIKPPDVVDRPGCDISGVKMGAFDTHRSEHAAVAQGKYMYVFGGWRSGNPTMNIVDQNCLDDVQVLDVEKMQWVTPTLSYPFTVPRGDHTATLVGEQVWIFGGQNASHYALSEWRAFNIAAGDPRDSVKKPDEAKKQNRVASSGSASSGSASSGLDDGSVMSIFQQLNNSGK